MIVTNGGRVILSITQNSSYDMGKIDTFLFGMVLSWSERDDYVIHQHHLLDILDMDRVHHEAIGVGAGSSDVFVFGGRQHVVGNDLLKLSLHLCIMSLSHLLHFIT